MMIESFLGYLRYERNYSENTVNAYRRDLAQWQRFLQEEERHSDLLEVDVILIRDWMYSLMKKGYTSTSVNRKLSSLRSFYKYLLKKGVIDVDPLCKVVGPKNDKPLPVFVREEDMDRLLDEVDWGDGFKAVRDHLIVGMFYATGIRLSELIGLNDADVDVDAALLKVTGKRNKQRLIPFDESLKEEICHYRKVRDAEVSCTAQAFFVKETGERMYRNLVYNLVKRNLSKVVTLKKRSPHVLRHTFATTMLNHDAELIAVKDLLGHESLAATEVYTHTTFEELKKVYKQAHPRA